MEFKMKRAFFEKYRGTDLNLDPLPLKVLNYKIWHSELKGHVLDIAQQYLHQKGCPDNLISPLLGKILSEISREDLSDCYTCKQRPDEDEVDSEEVSNKSYQPLKLMHSVTTKVDEICLTYKEECEQIETDFPDEAPFLVFGANHHTIKNTRRTLEDRSVILPNLQKVFTNLSTPASYFAVFDGHNGMESASFAAAHLHHHLITSPDFPSDIPTSIQYAFEATDTALLMKGKEDNIRSGTTAVIALLVSGHIYVAWVGDSQAILIRNSKPITLVNPHKPEREDEMVRIRNAGGEVIKLGGMYRVNGSLAVSRAIGDRDYKDCVSSTPDINHIVLDGQEEALILACDGLWDHVEPQTCVDIFKQSVLSENPSDIDTVSQKLVKQAKVSGSGDNITVVTVLLKPKEELRQIYNTDTKMNGIEDSKEESSVLPSSISTTTSSTTADALPVLEPVSPMAEPTNPNMKLFDSESPILAPKSPVSQNPPVVIESKTSKAPLTKTTSASKTPSKSTTPLRNTPRSSLLSTNKTSSPAKTTPVKTTTALKSPATQPATKKPIGVTAVKTTMQNKPTVPGVSRTTTTTVPPKTTAPRPPLAKTALTTKKLKTDETDKPTSTTTTTRATAPKTRPITAPSTSSRLTAAKAAPSASSVTSKVGEPGKKTDSTTTGRLPNRTATSSSARPTTATTRTTTISATQRQPPTTTTSRPRPQTATTKPATTITSKPPSAATTTTTKTQISRPPLSKPSSRMPATGVASKAASKTPPTTTTTAKKAPSSAPTTSTRQPIRRPTTGVDKKDTKVNGIASKVIEKVASTVASTVAKAETEPTKEINTEKANDATINIANEVATTKPVEAEVEKRITNGDIDTQSFMVTTPYNVAENIVDTTPPPTTTAAEDIKLESQESVLNSNVEPTTTTASVPLVDEPIIFEKSAVIESSQAPSATLNNTQDILNELDTAISSTQSEIVVEESESQQKQQEQEVVVEDHVPEKVTEEAVLEKDENILMSTISEPVGENISQEESEETTKIELSQDRDENVESREEKEVESLQQEQQQGDKFQLEEEEQQQQVEENNEISLPKENFDLVSDIPVTQENVTQENLLDNNTEILRRDNVEFTQDLIETTKQTIENHEDKPEHSVDLISNDNELVLDTPTPNIETDNQQQEQSQFFLDNQSTQNQEESERQQESSPIIESSGDLHTEQALIDDDHDNEDHVSRSSISVEKSECKEEEEEEQVEADQEVTTTSLMQDVESNIVEEDKCVEIEQEKNLLIDDDDVKFEDEIHHQTSSVSPLNAKMEEIEKLGHDDDDEIHTEGEEVHKGSGTSIETESENLLDETCSTTIATQDKVDQQNVDFYSSSINNETNELKPLESEDKSENMFALDETQPQQQLNDDEDIVGKTTPSKLNSTSEEDCFSTPTQQFQQESSSAVEGAQNPFKDDMLSTSQQQQQIGQNPFSSEDAFFSPEPQHQGNPVDNPIDYEFEDPLKRNIFYEEFGATVEDPYQRKPSEPKEHQEFVPRSFDDDGSNKFAGTEFHEEETDYPGSHLPPGCELAPEFVPRQFSTFGSSDPFTTTDDEHNFFTTTAAATTTTIPQQQHHRFDEPSNFPPQNINNNNLFTDSPFTNGNSILQGNGVSNGDTKVDQVEEKNSTFLEKSEILDTLDKDIGHAGENKTVISHALGEHVSTSDDMMYDQTF